MKNVNDVYDIGYWILNWSTKSIYENDPHVLVGKLSSVRWTHLGFPSPHGCVAFYEHTWAENQKHT
jgi:hypothetical protein